MHIKRLTKTVWLGSRSNLLRLDLDLDLIFCFISLRLGSRYNLLQLDLDLIFCLISLRLGPSSNAVFQHSPLSHAVELSKATTNFIDKPHVQSSTARSRSNLLPYFSVAGFYEKIWLLASRK